MSVVRLNLYLNVLHRKDEITGHRVLSRMPLFSKTFKYLIMKRLLILIAIFVFTGTVHGQYLTRFVKDSVTNTTAKTKTWTQTKTGLTAIRVSFDNSTGTSAGYALLYYRVDDVNGANEWVRVPGSDTAFILDNSTTIWNLTNAGLGHAGNGYEVRFVPSGTHKTYVWLAYLRR